LRRSTGERAVRFSVILTGVLRLEESGFDHFHIFHT